MKVSAGPARLAARSLAVAAAASLAVLPILKAGQAQVVGINAAIRNRVLIRGAGAPQPRPAVLRQRIGLNDEVQTAASSQLQILLLDRSVFTVGANARLTIDRFVFDPRRNRRTVSASVTRGAFRFMSGRQLGLSANPVSIRTPVATIGIRGTILDGVVGSDAIAIAAGEAAVGPGVAGDDGAASLIVLRGPGPGTQGNGRRGVIDVRTTAGTVTLDRPSLAVYIPRRGAAPIGPFAISQAGLVQLQQLLSPPLARALSVASAASQPPPAGDGGRAEFATQNQGTGPQAGPAAGSAPLERSAPVHGSPIGTGLWLFAGGVIVVLILIAASGEGSPRSP
jgi:hypothetical protein